MKRKHVYHIALTAVLAALTTVSIFFLRVPVGPGIVHLGDVFILLSAVLLPTPYAMVVGALGGGMANVLGAGGVIWAPATVVVKSTMTLPFGAKQNELLTPRNLLALLPYWAITVVGYAVYEMLFVSLSEVWHVVLIRSAVSSTVQVLGSALVFIALATVLEKAKFKQRIGLSSI